MDNQPAARAAGDGGGLPPEVAEMLVDGTPSEPAAPSEEEGRAYRLGWRPKEEFRGPETKWLPHDKFLQKVEQETPVLRERLRSQDNIIQGQQREIAETKRLVQEQKAAMDELLERSRGAENRGFEYAREQLKARMRQAVADADTNAFAQAERDLEDLDKKKPAPKPTAADRGPQVDPEVKVWADENPWFTNDRKLNNFAIAAEQALMAEEPHLSTRERLAKVKDELQRRFPEKFENPARKQPGAVAQPSAQSTRQPAKKTKTVADLDDDAKAALAKLKRLNPSLTDADYLKAYKWDKS